MLCLQHLLRDDEVDSTYGPVFAETGDSSFVVVNEETCLYLVCRTLGISVGGRPFVSVLYC